MISAATTCTRSDVRSNLDQLLTLRHSDPRSIAGTHPGPDGIVIRTFRPDAEKVREIARDALVANSLG
jgi:alpha-1,4-glucan branchign enzyme GlgB-like protein